MKAIGREDVSPRTSPVHGTTFAMLRPVLIRPWSKPCPTRFKPPEADFHCADLKRFGNGGYTDTARLNNIQLSILPINHRHHNGGHDGDNHSLMISPDEKRQFEWSTLIIVPSELTDSRVTLMSTMISSYAPAASHSCAFMHDTCW